MHVRQLAQMAGWLAASDGGMQEPSRTGEGDCGMRYWSASKCRLQRWQTALKVFEKDFTEPDEMHDPWFAAEVVIQEILVSDLLTRVWTAMLVQSEGAPGHQERQSVGYSVFIGHLELRNRAMRLVLHNRASGQGAYDRINSLRLLLERWTDLLLSRIDNTEIAAQFGFDRHRVGDFAGDRHLEDSRRRRQMGTMLQASLAAALQDRLSACSANPDLNREIAAGILECCPMSLFETTGLPGELAHLRAEQAGDDAATLLEDLTGGGNDFTA
jgi:hypothetical protein